MNKLAIVGLLAVGALLAGCQKPANKPQAMTDQQTLAPQADKPQVQTPAIEPAPTFTPAPVPPPQPVAQAPAPPPIPQPTAQSAQRVHVVQPGETLWRIMTQYYGKATKQLEKKVVAANPGLNPDKLRPGQKIVIP